MHGVIASIASRMQRRKKPPSATRRAKGGGEQLLAADYAKDTVEILSGSGGVEELVGIAVVGRTATELDSPEPVGENEFVFGIQDCSNPLAGRRIVAVDASGGGVVADQQGVAERAEVGGRHGNSPGVIEVGSFDQGFYEGSVLVEDVDVSA